MVENDISFNSRRAARGFPREFNNITNNLNQCIEAINGLVNDAQALAQAAADGQLSTRADAPRHAGDFPNDHGNRRGSMNDGH